MSISDEKLYRLALDAEPARMYSARPNRLPELTSDYDPEAVEALRSAILERFKPREPRVIDGWGVVDQYKNFILLGFKNEDGAKEWFASGRKDSPESYLAKATITEVLDSE